MDSNAVKRMLDVESTHVEWKESYRNREEIYRAVSAFANDLSGSGAPGHLLVGVDRHGKVVGLPWANADDRDKGLQELAGLFRQVKIVPNPSVDVEAVDVDGKTLAVLRVTPYAVPPVVKVDGDRDTFPEFEPWLGLEDVVRRTPNSWKPTVTGLLLHGLDTQAWFPGAVVDFVRYDGTDYEATPVLRKRMTGTLGRQLDATWSQLEALNATVPAPPDGIKQGFVDMFPPEVLKELTRNLVQHRRYDQTNAPGRISWFDDRIEFNNPGGPFGAASEGVFGEHSDYRNPTVTQGLVELGYVQRLGRGVRVSRRILERAGHPDLLVETDGYTIVTVFGRP